jgi:hypothetical protein
VVNQILVFQIKFCGKSPALRVAAKRYMQSAMTFRHSGSTRTLAFRLTSERYYFLSKFDILTREFKIFLWHIFGFDKPVMAKTNLAHLLLHFLPANTLTKSKELNCYRTNNLVAYRWASVFARALDAPKSAPLAYGIFYFYSATECCRTKYFIKTFGFT